MRPCAQRHAFGDSASQILASVVLLVGEDRISKPLGEYLQLLHSTTNDSQ